MNQKINKIIKYAKSIGFVEVKRSDYYIHNKSTYYGLPELPSHSWFMRLYSTGLGMALDIVNAVFISGEGIIETSNVKPYDEFRNYKYHLNSLLKKSRDLILISKEIQIKQKIAEINKDFE